MERAMLFPSTRIERKYHQSLEQLDPELELNGTFTNHLADAIQSSSRSERQQALDKAIEAYENTPNDAFLGMFGI
jgi:hypothetical protein